MRLSKLINKGTSTLRQDWTNVEIKGLSADSRNVRPGYLFAAIPGNLADGRNYIDAAIAAGASAILAPTGTKQPISNENIPFITDINPRQRLAHMAARFFGKQPENVVAVTGTNGKTSVAHFAQQLWTLAGAKAASLGTLGVTGPGYPARGGLTTPGPVALQKTLSDLKVDQCDHLCIEASSHGLDQNRIDGVRIKAAAFTNLSRDHLDYHKTFNAYRDAKFRLFRELLCEGGTVVANAETNEAETLQQIANNRSLKFISYGLDVGDICLESRKLTPNGWSLKLRAFNTLYEAELSLPGAFQIVNIIAAMGLLHACGAAISELVALLPKLKSVPGRMQKVGITAAGGKVYVDYAHTPDALNTALQSVRLHTVNKLVVVFGCGGDRDRGKRPQMGTIACNLADTAIITDDNPRSENPAMIRSEIMAACNDATEIADREQAIKTAIGLIGPGDTLVIAGKGHETGQTIDNKVYPFDDFEVASAALRETK